MKAFTNEEQESGAVTSSSSESESIENSHQHVGNEGTLNGNLENTARGLLQDDSTLIVLPNSSLMRESNEEN